MYWGLYAKRRLLTPGDNPGGYTALSAHYAAVLPASTVIRRQISYSASRTRTDTSQRMPGMLPFTPLHYQSFQSTTISLSQTWDMRFKVHCTANLPPFFMRPVSNIPHSAFGIRTPSQLHPGTSSMFFTGCHGFIC